MKFEIRRTKSYKDPNDGYFYVLKGGNGEIMMVSEMLSSKQNCKKSIASIKRSMGFLIKTVDTTILPLVRRDIHLPPKEDRYAKD